MRAGEGWRANLGLKLLSVGLALLLWSFVHGTKIIEHVIELPVRCTNLPDSLMLLAAPPRTARVLVAGPAQDLLLRRVLPGAELRLDLARARPPVHRVTPALAEVHLGAQERLRPVRILEPGPLDLAVERRVERRLAVHVVLAGAPAAAHVLAGTPQATPEFVRCAGPASRLAGLGRVDTRPIDISGRRDGFEATVALALESPLVDCDPTDVRVTVGVARGRRRELADRPLTILAPRDLAVDAHPAHATLTLVGPAAQIDALDPTQVAIVLDASSLGPGTHRRVRLLPKLPPWAHLDSLEPAAVDVTIRKPTRRR